MPPFEKQKKSKTTRQNINLPICLLCFARKNRSKGEIIKRRWGGSKRFFALLRAERGKSKIWRSTCGTYVDVCAARQGSGSSLTPGLDVLEGHESQHEAGRLLFNPHLEIVGNDTRRRRCNATFRLDAHRPIIARHHLKPHYCLGISRSCRRERRRIRIRPFSGLDCLTRTEREVHSTTVTTALKALLRRGAAWNAERRAIETRALVIADGADWLDAR